MTDTKAIKRHYHYEGSDAFCRICYAAGKRIGREEVLDILKEVHDSWHVKEQQNCYCNEDTCMIRHVESLLAGKERDSGNGSLSEDKPLKRSLPSYVSPETSKALQDFAKRVDIDGWCNEWMDYYEEPLTLRQFIKKKLEALKKEFGI